MVREAGKVYTVLGTPQFFGMLALLAIVDLEGVVVAGDNGELA